MERQIIWSSRELVGREGLMYLETSECTKINDLVTIDEPMMIENINVGVVLNTMDDEGEEYNTIIITDAEGNKYSTSSENFIRKFKEIVDYLNSHNDTEPYSIKVYKKMGKNSNPFITCNII